MFVRVRFFARSRELVGTSETRIELPSDRASFLFFVETLLQQYPVLEEIWESVMLSHNLDYVEKTDELELRDGDEIAIIPPISGG